MHLKISALMKLLSKPITQILGSHLFSLLNITRLLITSFLLIRKKCFPEQVFQ